MSVSEDRYVVVNGKGTIVSDRGDTTPAAAREWQAMVEASATPEHGPYSVMRVTLTPIEDELPADLPEKVEWAFGGENLDYPHSADHECRLKGCRIFEAEVPRTAWREVSRAGAAALDPAEPLRGA